MVHKALQLRDDIDKLYISRNEGRRGFRSIEDSVEISIGGLGLRLHKKKAMKD